MARTEKEVVDRDIFVGRMGKRLWISHAGRHDRHIQVLAEGDLDEPRGGAGLRRRAGRLRWTRARWWRC